MPDVETRGDLAELLKSNCPFRTLLDSGESCPRLGPSKTCVDCLFGWEIVSMRILKSLGAKRSAYEQERERMKACVERVDFLEKTLGDVFSSLEMMGDGFSALVAVLELAKDYKSEKEGQV